MIFFNKVGLHHDAILLKDGLDLDLFLSIQRNLCPFEIHPLQSLTKADDTVQFYRILVTPKQVPCYFNSEYHLQGTTFLSFCHFYSETQNTQLSDTEYVYGSIGIDGICHLFIKYIFISFPDYI